MAAVTLHALHKNFGPVPVLKGIDLQIANGEFVAFVGPSGCGKSTLLRLIAGLEAASSGSIHFDGRDMTNAAAKERQVAMVFQSYALYPHMTVRDNLSFGMRMRGELAAAISTKLARAVDMLQLAPYLDRKPGELSGGQNQRVAIGRAIVQEPGVFLFDEPLSNLDAELRLRMRVEIAALHRQLGTTMVYVTHDQVEAMTLAQRIVVLRDGAIEQVGTPMQLYTNPANRFVAGFIGAPAMNFLPATLQTQGAEQQALVGGVTRLPVALHTSSSAAATNDATGTAGTTGEAGAARAANSPCLVGIRPEHLAPVAPGDSLQGCLEMQVNFIERLGASNFVHGTVDGAPVVAESRGPVVAHAGENLWLRPQPEMLHVFNPQGLNIGRNKPLL
jgi:lactose/L-arabinose transport system ATP-binding protein